MEKNVKRKKSKLLKYLFVFLLFCISIGLMVYPYISNYIFENRADGIIETVEKTAEEADEHEYVDAINEAHKYNDTIANGHIQLKDPFVEDIIAEDTAEYNSLLNMTDDGVMGFIKIPCIDVSLPIYHGTSEEILEIGAGHLQGTSLPVGGDNTHSAITGHTGLSSAKLFTDLTELEEGDMFFLYVMGEDLAYKVDQITTVKPDELDNLATEKGKDYCTLITCTPYGVNSHRLLVRGERTDYKEAVEEPEVFKKKKVESKWQQEYAKSIAIAGIVFLILMIILLIWRYHENKVYEEQLREKRKKQRKKKEKIVLRKNFKIGEDDGLEIIEERPHKNVESKNKKSSKNKNKKTRKKRALK